MTAPTSHIPYTPTGGTQQLVLLGASHAHLQLLTQLAAHPLPRTQVVLVEHQRSLLLPSMLGGFVAGDYSLEACAIPLAPLVHGSGIRWLERSAVAVDMAQQTLQLDDGSVLAFDWLSVNTSPIQDRASIEQALPGAREHALFTHPAETFATLWPRVVTLGEERPLRIAVLGDGAVGVEIALAARQRLPNAAVTLVCGTTLAGDLDAPTVQNRLLALLKKRGVTVLQDMAKSLRGGNIQLGCGADLACDVPIVAGHARAPLWIADSALALDRDGLPAVDAYQRSASHSRVFAVDPNAHAGSALLHNIGSAMAGTVLKPHPPTVPSWHIVAGGQHYAVGTWRRFTVQGRWVWWLKHWMDRRLVTRCAPPGL